MAILIDELMNFFGVSVEPVTLIDFFIWFVKMSFGCALFRYVLYGFFWLGRQFSREGRR